MCAHESVRMDPTKNPQQPEWEAARSLVLMQNTTDYADLTSF